MKQDYQRALDAARADYDKLLKEREGIDARLRQTADVIMSISKILGEESERINVPPAMQAISDTRLGNLNIFGLTDALRILLQSSIGATQATELRDRLLFYKYDMTKYSNQMAAVHGVLARLIQAKEATIEQSEGKTFYRWAELSPFGRFKAAHDAKTARENHPLPGTFGEKKK